jgi:cell division protein FtsQ
MTAPSLRRRVSLVLRAMMVGLLGLVAGVVVLKPDPAARSQTGSPDRLGEIITAAGLGIDEVVVTGHRFTPDSDILDSVDLANVRTMMALDSAQVKARVERLPWIASATITRVYPGRIDIAVTERAPFAVWLAGTSATLVDETGRPLAAVAPTYFPALPRLSGVGAPTAGRALFHMLRHVPEIHARLLRADRIADRRWSLELTDGLRLELPSEGEATALAELTRLWGSLLAQRNTVVDLRSRREIAVRPAGAS